MAKIPNVYFSELMVNMNKTPDSWERKSRCDNLPWEDLIYSSPCSCPMIRCDLYSKYAIECSRYCLALIVSIWLRGESVHLYRYHFFMSGLGDLEARLSCRNTSCILALWRQIMNRFDPVLAKGCSFVMRMLMTDSIMHTVFVSLRLGSWQYNISAEVEDNLDLFFVSPRMFIVHSNRLAKASHKIRAM